MRRIRKFLLLSVLLTLAFALRAQNTAGSITGRITDPSGAAVLGAQIEIRNIGTGERRSLASSESGDYTATLLQPGRYSVTTSAPGFKTSSKTGITLDVAQVVRIDFSLQIGSTSEMVEVQASALSLDTDSMSVAQTINERQVGELPLNGRSFVGLLFLEPGAVQTSGEQSSSRYGAGDAISIGGGISSSNAYTLDGTMITDTGFNTPAWNISLEAIQEFKEQTKNYSAEFGFGANQINLSTKSGSNTLHGSLFEFIRNTAVDARSYFNRAPNPVAPLKQNQFGYALGGPVLLPLLYNGHDKTFFFANYEGQRIRTSVTSTGYTPLTDELNGIFLLSSINSTHAATANIIDPLTNTAFSTNSDGAYVIPSGRFSRLAQLAIAKGFFPTPNVTGNSSYNYVANLPSTVNEDQQNYRIDQVFSSKDSGFVRASLSNVLVTLPSSSFLTSYGDTIIDQKVRNYQVTETHIFTPNLLNQIRLGYLESMANRTGPTISSAERTTLAFQNVFSMTDANYPVIALASGMSSSSSLNATQSLATTGGAANLPTQSLQPAWDFSDSVSWTHGAHTIAFGFDFHLLKLDRHSTVNPQGNFTFDGEMTHNQIADLLLGTPIKAQVAQPGPISNVAEGNFIHLHFNAWAPYFQDDWKVTSKLTVNLGIRYDYSGVPFEEQNHFAWFNPDVSGGGLYMANQSVASTYGGSIYSYNSNRGPGPALKNVLAPRIGFSWRPFGNGKNVLRGGYGLFYDSFQTNEFVSSTAVYPFAPTSLYTSTPGSGTPYQTDSLFPALTVGTVSQSTFINSVLQIAATKKMDPYEQDWSLGIERQLDSKTILNLDYVGNKATHLNIRTELNQPTPCNATTSCDPDLASNATAAGKQTRRPYPNFGLIVYEGWNGFSKYNALNIKLQRSEKNLSLLVAYAWSKMMDVKSAAAAVGGDAYGAYGPQNTHCMRCEYARSSYDVGQRFVFAALYYLPFGHNQRFGAQLPSWADRIAGGWQINGIGTFQGGFPFTITASDHNYVNEAYAERANLVGNPYPAGFKKNIAHWFDTSAFSQPADGYFGNSSRNLLRGPGIHNIDLSLFKNFPFTKFNVQFRLESFNAFNHPEFSFPSANVNGGSAFGTITSINAHQPQRQNQGSLKVVF